jgi:hypothetical protein
MMPPFTRLPGRDLAGPGLRAGQRADRRGRLALGLGFATTGALLNHGAQMTWKVPPNGRVLRSPRGPKNADCDESRLTGSASSPLRLAPRTNQRSSDDGSS